MQLSIRKEKIIGALTKRVFSRFKTQKVVFKRTGQVEFVHIDARLAVEAMMNLDPAHLLEGTRPPVQVADYTSQRFCHSAWDQTQLLGVQDFETLEQLLVLHHQVEQHDDLGERHLRIHNHLQVVCLLPDKQLGEGGRRSLTFFSFETSMM